MSKYQIHRSKLATVDLTEDRGICIDASSSLDWAISLPFEYVRGYCKRKGWLVVTVEETPVTTLEFHGSHYEIQWDLQRIASITKDGEQVSWRELPEQLKGLL